MTNYEQIEDAALYGIRESLEFDLANSESGYFEEDGRIVNDYQDEEIAEAIYCRMLGYTN